MDVKDEMWNGTRGSMTQFPIAHSAHWGKRQSLHMPTYQDQIPMDTKTKFENVAWFAPAILLATSFADHCTSLNQSCGTFLLILHMETRVTCVYIFCSLLYHLWLPKQFLDQVQSSFMT